MAQNKRIAVVGGNGKAGRFVVQKALEKGYAVRMLVRNPQRVTVSDERIEVTKGNAEDISSIQALLEGCDAVINTLGQPNKATPIYSKVTSHILATMKERGIQRYITVTGGSLNAPGDRKSPINKIGAWLFQRLYADMITDKEKELRILLKSDADWTLVRLPFVIEKPAVSKIKVNLYDMPGMKMTNSDIADFLVNQISDTKYIRKYPFISN
ncbi:NAD(P)-dependent oxidoreductase [Sporolactobacillus laevolacticus]|uniref:NADH-flavin reductase n=1 Tax=Sporolactobacillus laevolacticus DSM 442 TaxID=1395513 RepID=V6J062_9BACL|nr:SDR family oxidoreductase [Sporolactobacillus laevolacticus]EST12546.1 NADH-flavin reductase [Sporolactobacillus laevolacticus DSM 442]